MILKLEDTVREMHDQVRDLKENFVFMKVQLKNEVLSEVYENTEEEKEKEEKKNKIIFNLDGRQYETRQERVQEELTTCVQVTKRSGNIRRSKRWCLYTGLENIDNRQGMMKEKEAAGPDQWW